MTGSLEAAMRFVAKSVFWLGLVYSAMPFDSGTPIALAPTPGAMPGEASSSLESLAAAVIPAARQNPDGWKSAVEVAAALCAPNCLRAAAARLSPTGGPPAKDPAGPTLRRVSREKSDREGAVRPPAANHIRSQDRQT
jgi:hypothetical protein